MKVQVLQESLARGLGVVSRAVAARSTLPITANVLVQTDAVLGARLGLEALPPGWVWDIERAGELLALGCGAAALGPD